MYGLGTPSNWYPGQLFAITTSLHLVVAIITISSLYNDHVHSVELQLSKARSVAVETQLKNLQQQVDPHFLFNSLNILRALIQVDKERSLLFTQKLSEVYRFFLKTQKEVVISLEDELAFVEDYFYLVNCRFGNAFKLKIEGANGVTGGELYIIPGTLQLLVENAIKHNTASEEKPLTVCINIEEDKVFVINPVVKKENHSSGYGLNNLVERYQLLKNEKINYTEEEGMFAVCIPLIKNLLH
ncbi:MAG TPA: sensor histidine kinase [Segetibacter sp.]